MNFLLRLFMIAAGLLLGASMAIAAILILALWGVRAAWAKLTGRPVTAFMMGIDPRSGFERMYRKAGQGSRTPRADALRPARNAGDVTDVEARPPAL